MGEKKLTVQLVWGLSNVFISILYFDSHVFVTLVHFISEDV